MALRLSTGLRNLLMSQNAGALTGISFGDLFIDGVIYIYTGAQPATADLTESGTNILIITESSGAFTPGAPGNGLEFEEDSVAGVISKAAAETWSGIGIGGGGTAGWFRFYANARTQGASTTAVRFDGQCATVGGELTMSSTTIVTDATTTIDTFTITLPTS
jgi:hypothetical protein